MTSKTFALLALAVCVVIAAVAYAMRPEPIIAQGGSFLPRDDIFQLNDQ